MIINISGKGGAGKTSVVTLLIDELAHHNFAGRTLVFDGDPAATLAFALGIERQPVTLADIRDTTPLDARQIRQLPPGVSPAQFVLDRLQKEGVIVHRQIREIDIGLMAMDHPEGPGCDCRVNQALTQALTTLRATYDLIILDNEGGLEHVSRYRLKQVDLFLIVLTPGRSSWLVADRLRHTADSVELDIGETWLIYNRIPGRGVRLAGRNTLLLPECETIAALDRQGGPLPALADDHPVRQALNPLIERIGQPAGHLTG